MLIPKKAQHIILAIFILFFAAILVRHKILEFDINDLVAMKSNGFAEVFVVADDKKYTLSSEQAYKLLRAITEMKSQWWTGWKGEDWKEYCSLNFRNKKDKTLYRIDFSTRASLEGIILARLQRVSGSSKYYYGVYNGNEVVSILNMFTHKKCIKRVPR